MIVREYMLFYRSECLKSKTQGNRGACQLSSSPTRAVSHLVTLCTSAAERPNSRALSHETAHKTNRYHRLRINCMYINTCPLLNKLQDCDRSLLLIAVDYSRRGNTNESMMLMSCFLRKITCEMERTPNNGYLQMSLGPPTSPTSIRTPAETPLRKIPAPIRAPVVGPPPS